MKNIYSPFYGGCIDVEVVERSKLPRKARYKYTDLDYGYDIYMYTTTKKGDVFYAVLTK